MEQDPAAVPFSLVYLTNQCKLRRAVLGMDWARRYQGLACQRGDMVSGSMHLSPLFSTTTCTLILQYLGGSPRGYARDYYQTWEFLALQSISGAFLAIQDFLFKLQGLCRVSGSCLLWLMEFSDASKSFDPICNLKELAKSLSTQVQVGTGSLC